MEGAGSVFIRWGGGVQGTDYEPLISLVTRTEVIIKTNAFQILHSSKCQGESVTQLFRKNIQMTADL